MKLLSYIKIESVKKKGTVLVGALIISNFLNFLYNAYLGRVISIADFALIGLIGSILSLTDIPIGALGKTVTYKCAYLLGRYKRPATKFWLHLRKKSLVTALAASLLWVIFAPLTAKFFNLESALPILLFTPIWLFAVVSAVDSGYLNGNLKFGILGLIMIVEALVKLVSAYVIVSLGFPQYAYVAVVISSFLSFVLLAFAAMRLKSTKKTYHRDSVAFPKKFYASSSMMRISTIFYLAMDVLLAKHFLLPEQAGQYALLSLSGKIVFFAGSLFAQFIVPVVSHREGEGSNSRKTFYKLLGATVGSSFVAYIFVGLFGWASIPFLFGEKALPIVQYIPAYALSMVAFTVAINIIGFHQIRNKHALPVIGFGLSIFQILGIVLFHDSVGTIAYVMSFMGFVSLGVVLIYHLFEPFFITVARNLKDFFGVFLPYKSQKTQGLRILIYNWRDRKHVWAGGAEVYIDELAKRWVKEGNTVTLFCGNDGICPRDETVNGVKIIRRGGFYTVYIWAVLYHVFKFRGNFDVIVDSENGIPFFTPLFSTKPIILLIHHVHQEIFIEQLKFPLSHIARFLEARLMPFIYKNRTVVTVSESSKKEIVKLGIANEEAVQIVNPGIDIAKKKKEKTDFPSVVYLGRLKAYKNVDVAIRAFAKVKKRFPSARLWIVGEGDSLGLLRDLVISLNLTKSVRFFGKVSEEYKCELLSQSWVAVQPSQMEGWGITVLEANACRTPVIASDTKGLRDSIVDGKTGVLVRVRDTKQLSKELTRVVRDPIHREELSKNAYHWSKKFSWDASALQFLSIVNVEFIKRQRAFSPFSPARLINKLASLI